MAKPIVGQRDVVILQRDPGNLAYEEIHISGSDLILCTDNQGYLTANRRNAFSASWASGSRLSSTSSFVNFTSETIPAGGPTTLQGYVQIQIGGANYWIPYYSSP